MRYFISRAILFAVIPALLLSCGRTYRTDVLVIGGTTSGTSAAIAAARLGVKVTVVEESPMLGGMLTAQGVSATDGNYELHTGIWKEFQDSLFAYYGGPRALMTGWVSLIQFEPHVGDRIFRNMLGHCESASVFYGYHLTSVIMEGSTVKGACFENVDGDKLRVEALITIDATDLGDALPLSGTEYRLGMDSREETGESAAPAERNDIIQDLTLVGVLKDYGPDADMTIPEPEGFDRSEFDGLNITSDSNKIAIKDVLSYGCLPNDKYMLNWPGAHGNDTYLDVVELPYHSRQETLRQAREKTLRFIYYIQTVLGYSNLGIADDEFDTEDGLAYQPYHREGRRLNGIVTITVDDIADRYSNNKYRTGVSVGNYPIDHHHSQYPGELKIDFPKVPSFCIGAGVMIPEKTDGLIVSDKAISASNLANGSTRLQPVVLATGQAAGTLAALCVKNGCNPREIGVRKLQQALLDRKCYLQPLFDVDYDDPAFEAVQRVTSTGILRMTGEPYKWDNRTWFYPDSVVSTDEVIAGIKVFYGSEQECVGAVEKIAPHLEHPMTRREAAVLIDEVLDPFSKEIDFEGNVIEN